MKKKTTAEKKKNDKRETYNIQEYNTFKNLFNANKT